MDSRPSEIVIQDGRAYHLGLRPDQVAPHVLLVGDPARALRVAERFERRDHDERHREFVSITGVFRGLPVTVVGTGIGTDNVEIAVMELAILHEFDLATRRRLPGRPPLTLLRIGTSGGVPRDLAPGTVAVALYALGLDSTGLYYERPPEDDVVRRIEDEARRLILAATPAGYRFRGRIEPYAARACPEVAAALERALAARGLVSRSGITVAVPGFYGASGRYIEGLRNTVPDIKKQLAALDVDGLRALNFEMESSLLFHLAGALGYRAGTLCAVISNPHTGEVLLDHRLCVEGCIDAALDALVALAG